MTQALARKWRPKNFGELVGQPHVVRALTHALTQGRLHHAWLFTGTRGVGKTTIARILAKGLNCETGVTALPCGACSACLEIDAGRFVDLVELDAASNTQVDQMRDLLERAMYAPTRARFKVYIIDEVHMLSRSAFNAMLKTLEEPPAHVKFILATTDPQRVPVTVLSRCLQFGLKQIPVGEIHHQLDHVLGAEGIDREPAALALIARAAQGSLRDALSLLDQAISHGAGRVLESAVRDMLGVVDGSELHRLLEALARGDGAAMLEVADALAAQSIDLELALQELASLLHRLAIAQRVPQAIAEDDPEASKLRELAGAIAAEDLQLYYDIALRGRAELHLAPDEYAGFSMTLLRMLAFSPQAEALAGGTPNGPGGTPMGAGPGQAGTRSAAASPPRVGAAAVPAGPRAAAALLVGAPTIAVPAGSVPTARPSPAPEVPASTPRALNRQEESRAAPQTASAALQPEAWPALLAELKLGGMARMLAQHSELLGEDQGRVRLRVPSAHRHLLEKSYREKLQTALEERLGRGLALEFSLGESSGNTLVEVDDRQRAERYRRAVESIETDSFVQELLENFDGRVIDESIRPVG